MIGQRFGKLTVVRDSGQRYRKHKIYECLCDCGKTCFVKSGNLQRQKSCGCSKHNPAPHKKHNLNRRKPSRVPLTHIGDKINKLTIIDIIQEFRKPTMAVCECECGNIIQRPYRSVVKGRVKSCGCIRKTQLEAAKQRKLIKEQESTLYHYKDFSGERFGTLTVLYLCGVHIRGNGSKQSLWYCKCDCGKFIIKKTPAFSIKNISCGCTLRSERAKRAKAITKLQGERRKNLLYTLGEDTTPHNHRRMTATVRKLSFIKYGNRCLICSIEDNKKEPLCIHHLRPHWAYPKLRYFPINNIPLCRKCHDDLHKVFGTFNPSVKEQVEYIAKQKQAVGLTYILSGRVVRLNK